MHQIWGRKGTKRLWFGGQFCSKQKLHWQAKVPTDKLYFGKMFSRAYSWIGPFISVLLVVEQFSHKLTEGKMLSRQERVNFDRIFVKPTANQDKHKIYTRSKSDLSLSYLPSNAEKGIYSTFPRIARLFYPILIKLTNNSRRHKNANDSQMRPD